jgi:hypothetical protein
MQRSATNTSAESTTYTAALANAIARNVMQSLLLSSLYCGMSFLIAPAQTDGELKPHLAG